MNRRNFLATAAAATSALAGSQSGGSAKLPIRKAMVYGNLPEKMSVMDRFQALKDTGFEAVECHTTPEQSKADEIKAAAEKTGIRIHSVMNSDHWTYPLSSPDPEVIKKSLTGMETSLRNAKFWGADTVLLVPAVVTPQIGYGDAWKRSQEHIRKLIPMAQDLKVIIAIEEVWNKFLISPLEMAHYVDEFKSPWVKAYFDVGNVLLYGYPQDWIRTLGNRTVKLHLKDFSFRNDPTIKKRVADWVDLRDGDIDWKAIYDALAAINYKGYASVEIGMKNLDHLKETSRRFDLILTRA